MFPAGSDLQRSLRDAADSNFRGPKFQLGGRNSIPSAFGHKPVDSGDGGLSWSDFEHLFGGFGQVWHDAILGDIGQS